MTISVSKLTDAEVVAYQEYITNEPTALFEHTIELKNLIAKYFGFNPHYLLAKEEGKIVGVLPLFFTSSLIEGKRLVSVPFMPYGGVIGSVPAQQALLEAACMVASKVKFLQIRQRGGLPSNLEAKFVRQAPILDFIITLQPTVADMWLHLPRDVRRHIKKANQKGLRFQLAKDKKTFEEYYDLYLNTRKKRGVPAWPRGFFWDTLVKTDSHIGIIYHGNEPLAGGFFHMHKKEIFYGFSGADYTKLHLHPYHLLVWHMCMYGIKNGYSHIDYGPTTRQMNEGGLFHFKDRWCDTYKELPYYFYAKNVTNMPDFNSKLGLYTLYGKVWSKLPKKVIDIISPAVMRQFS